jgi:spore coat protein U-like protein
MGPGIIQTLRLRAGGMRSLRAAACAVLALAALVPVRALAQDTATATIQTAILDAGSIAKIADMNFGKIAQANVAGTVVMTPQASPTCTASALIIRTGVCKAAAFTIRGKRNERVRIRENNGGVVTLTGPAGATLTMDTMTIGVTGMVANNGGNGWDFGNWKITDPSGITNFYIGGTLHMAAAQTPGVYTGTINIQIQFN